MALIAAAGAAALAVPATAGASTVQFSGVLITYDAGFNEQNNVVVRPSFGNGVTTTIEDSAGISGCTPISSIAVRCDPAPALSEFGADLGSRNDTFEVDAGDGVSFTGAFFDVDGQIGDDDIQGADGRDQLQGGDGRDLLRGFGGQDGLLGGGGEDGLIGGDGDDSLSGRTHDDKLFGEGGNDTMIGGDGQDRLVGGPGRDRLEGSGGKDVLDAAGDGERDTIVCQGGDSVLRDANDFVVNPTACAD
jgi:Ca2+-binding RTX toxin-like protein